MEEEEKPIKKQAYPEEMGLSTLGSGDGTPSIKLRPATLIPTHSFAVLPCTVTFVTHEDAASSTVWLAPHLPAATIRLPETCSPAPAANRKVLDMLQGITVHSKKAFFNMPLHYALPFSSRTDMFLEGIAERYMYIYCRDTQAKGRICTKMVRMMLSRATQQHTFTHVQVVYPDREPFPGCNRHPRTCETAEEALARLLRPHLWPCALSQLLSSRHGCLAVALHCGSHEIQNKLALVGYTTSRRKYADVVCVEA